MRVAITGAAGQLGTELQRSFTDAGSQVIPLVRPGFTLEQPSLPGAVDLVVNAAAWTDVDACARDPERCMLLNGLAPRHLATLAADAGAGFMQISTNEVFNGVGDRTYDEGELPNPLNPYGISKAAGEAAVREAHPNAIVVRTAWIYGGPHSFPAKILRAARTMAESGRQLSVVSDEIGNPTPAIALADRIVALTSRTDAPRVIHLAGDPPISRFDWAARLIAAEGLPRPVPIAATEYPRDSTPPRHAVLDTSLARSLGLAIDWAAD